MMKSLYRLRHTPSGLFYKPSTHASPANLSKHGKTYAFPPTLKRVYGGSFIHPDDMKGARRWRKPAPRRTVPSEWEIVRYDVVEAASMDPETGEIKGMPVATGSPGDNK